MKTSPSPSAATDPLEASHIVRLTWRLYKLVLWHLYYPRRRLHALVRRIALQRAHLERRHDVAHNPVMLLLVYRSRNVRYVTGLLNQVGQDADIRLWALDEPHPTLAQYTLGSGTGAKFDLLNKLYQSRTPPSGAWTVVADDDVVLLSGSLRKLIAVASSANLGVFQPAHSISSFFSYPVTVRRPLTRVSITGFVEIGPIFAVSPGWHDAIFPFPAEMGMGWGLEVNWYGLQKQGCRLGIVDKVPMVHNEPVGTNYDTRSEAIRLKELVDSSGLTSLGDIMNRSQSWMAWQRTSPWVRRSDGLVSEVRQAEAPAG